MPSGFKSAGIDLDNLFDPDVVGDGPYASGLTSAGAGVKYAALIYGTKRADVGIQSAGADVSNLWAAKGTASYVSNGGLPANLFRLVDAPGASATGSVAFEFRRNGSVEWYADVGGSGNWTTPGPSAGDLYEIRYSLSGSEGAGTLIGVDGLWKQLNNTRAALFSNTVPAGSAEHSFRKVLVQIRRSGATAVLLSHQVTMNVSLQG